MPEDRPSRGIIGTLGTMAAVGGVGATAYMGGRAVFGAGSIFAGPATFETAFREIVERQLARGVSPLASMLPFESLPAFERAISMQTLGSEYLAGTYARPIAGAVTEKAKYLWQTREGQRAGQQLKNLHLAARQAKDRLAQTLPGFRANAIDEAFRMANMQVPRAYNVGEIFEMARNNATLQSELSLSFERMRRINFAELGIPFAELGGTSFDVLNQTMQMAGLVQRQPFAGRLTGLGMNIGERTKAMEAIGLLQGRGIDIQQVMRGKQIIGLGLAGGGQEAFIPFLQKHPLMKRGTGMLYSEAGEIMGPAAALVTGTKMTKGKAIPNVTRMDIAILEDLTEAMTGASYQRNPVRTAKDLLSRYQKAAVYDISELSTSEGMLSHQMYRRGRMGVVHPTTAAQATHLPALLKGWRNILAAAGIPQTGFSPDQLAKGSIALSDLGQGFLGTVAYDPKFHQAWKYGFDPASIRAAQAAGLDVSSLNPLRGAVGKRVAFNMLEMPMVVTEQNALNAALSQLGQVGGLAPEEVLLSPRMRAIQAQIPGRATIASNQAAAPGVAIQDMLAQLRRVYGSERVDRRLADRTLSELIARQRKTTGGGFGVLQGGTFMGIDPIKGGRVLAGGGWPGQVAINDIYYKSGNLALTKGQIEYGLEYVSGAGLEPGAKFFGGMKTVVKGMPAEFSKPATLMVGGRQFTATTEAHLSALLLTGQRLGGRLSRDPADIIGGLRGMGPDVAEMYAANLRTARGISGIMAEPFAAAKTQAGKDYFFNQILEANIRAEIGRVGAGTKGGGFLRSGLAGLRGITFGGRAQQELQGMIGAYNKQFGANIAAGSTGLHRIPVTLGNFPQTLGAGHLAHFNMDFVATLLARGGGRIDPIMAELVDRLQSQAGTLPEVNAAIQSYLTGKHPATVELNQVASQIGRLFGTESERMGLFKELTGQDIRSLGIQLPRAYGGRVLSVGATVGPRTGLFTPPEREAVLRSFDRETRNVLQAAIRGRPAGDVAAMLEPAGRAEASYLTALRALAFGKHGAVRGSLGGYITGGFQLQAQSQAGLLTSVGGKPGAAGWAEYTGMDRLKRGAYWGPKDIYVADALKMGKAARAGTLTEAQFRRLWLTSGTTATVRRNVFARMTEGSARPKGILQPLVFGRYPSVSSGNVQYGFVINEDLFVRKMGLKGKMNLLHKFGLGLGPLQPFPMTGDFDADQVHSFMLRSKEAIQTARRHLTPGSSFATELEILGQPVPRGAAESYAQALGLAGKLPKRLDLAQRTILEEVVLTQQELEKQFIGQISPHMTQARVALFVKGATATPEGLQAIMLAKDIEENIIKAKSITAAKDSQAMADEFVRLWRQDTPFASKVGRLSELAEEMLPPGYSQKSLQGNLKNTMAVMAAHMDEFDKTELGKAWKNLRKSWDHVTSSTEIFEGIGAYSKRPLGSEAFIKPTMAEQGAGIASQLWKQIKIHKKPALIGLGIAAGLGILAGGRGTPGTPKIDDFHRTDKPKIPPTPDRAQTPLEDLRSRHRSYRVNIAGTGTGQNYHGIANLVGAEVGNADVDVKVHDFRSYHTADKIRERMGY